MGLTYSLILNESQVEPCDVEVIEAIWDWKAFYMQFMDPQFAFVRDYFSFRVQENPQSPVGAALMYKVRT